MRIGTDSVGSGGRPTSHRVYTSAVLGFALVAAGCAGRLHLSGDVRPVEESEFSFESNGHTIRVDAYVPEGKGERHPAAIVLHGSGGLHPISVELSERYAEALAAKGIAAYVVHYFDATGTFMATLSTESREYWRWVRVVHDAVTAVRERPEVRANRVGLFGFSMGAYVAVGAAASDLRVSRVVLVSGGLEAGVADSVMHFPPVLLLHGTADDEVTLAEEDSLLYLLEQRRALVISHRYPGEGHQFSESAALDVVDRASRFLALGRFGTLIQLIRRTDAPRPERDTTRGRIP